jgi:hypothetical protein
VLISALATDYDGTLASQGEVDEATLEALKRLKASGRTLVMVTGRELPDLRRVFPQLGLFDAVVAENGALLFVPDRDEARLLGDPAPPALVQALQRLGVEPLAVGRSIVATSSAHAAEVEALIAELGLCWRTILNKDSVMCLPDGVDKASGLAAALDDLRIAPADVVGVGDAENDLVFLAACGLSVAVANALAQVKATADIVTEGDDGAGVAWLIDRLLAGALDDLVGRRLADA